MFMGASTIQRSVRIPAAEAAAYGPVGRSPWLDVDWRSRQRWLTVDGAVVNTIELGPDNASDAQPLVFVHGLSGCWANFLEQLPVMAREHRVVTLDLPGFGYSPMPPKEITIPGYATAARRALRDSSASTPPPSWATRWAASSRPSWRSRSRSGSSGWC